MSSPSCISVHISPPTVARQLLSKHVPASTDTHARIEELFVRRGLFYTVRAASDTQDTVKEKCIWFYWLPMGSGV
jgi:hypothetical protein